MVDMKFPDLFGKPRQEYQTESPFWGRIGVFRPVATGTAATRDPRRALGNSRFRAGLMLGAEFR